MHTQDDYSDIIDHPHHVSTIHPPMASEKRAAQFSPFAALTGFEDAIDEEARPVDSFLQMSEDRRQEINEKLRFLTDELNAGRKNTAFFLYFEPDNKKEGGKYLTALGLVNKIDEEKRLITLSEGDTVPLDRIFEIRLQ